VYGSKDMDGFYTAQLHGRLGLVPGNMVAEISPDEAYRMGDLSLNERPPPQRRRRSDVGCSNNNSDPTLASAYRSGRAPPFDPYDTGDPYAHRGSQPHMLDPRIRRMRFGQAKSRSEDYASGGGGGGRGMPSGYGRPSRGDYQPYYDSDRSGYDALANLASSYRHFRRPAYSARGAPSDYYRGSLDRRERPVYRDRSMPTRTPDDYNRR